MAFAVSAFIETILARLVNEEKYYRSLGIQSKVYKLGGSLSQIQALLNDVSHKEATDKAVGVWLNSLQHLCYDLDDVLDDAATKAMRRQLSKESKSITSKVTQKSNGITNKLQSVEKQKLDSITKRLQHLEKQKFALGLTVKDEKRKRNTTSLLEFNVVGREREKEEFLSKLFRDDLSNDNISVVPIVGMGGVGKTTLARLLYNDWDVQQHFNLRLWVCVSSEFDVFKISKTILQSVSDVNKGFEDLNQLQVALAEKFKNRRFLLVLDDVWTENYNSWEELVHPFQVGAPGSKIIMTTRKVQLLRNLGVDHIDCLESLSHEDALSLLALHALGVNNFDSHPTLITQAEGIVKKCGCLPLALKAFGRLLSTTKYGEDWDNLLNSEIWYLPNADEILQSFMLSYHDLSKDLQWLFGYCSLFPKGFLFDKEKLVLLWLAEGYLNKSLANESPERLGHYYFEKLLSRSFFQHAPDHESLYVMHDLMNDFATFVAGDCFLRFDNQMRMGNEASAKYLHMSYIREKYVGYKPFEAFRTARSLRTLLAISVGVDKSWNFVYLSNKILDDALPRLLLLRVLSLSNCNICKVDFIGSLKHLRYLNLSQTKITELPENVCNLYYLQTLIVFGCQNLTKLPKRFLKLKKLRHFDMRETPLLKMPLGIGELKSLQTLPKIIIGGDKGFAITNLKELKNLHGELSVEGLHKVQSSIHAREANIILNRLTKLVLKWDNVFSGSRSQTLEKEVLNELKPYSNTLKELAIVSYGGMDFPKWVGDPSFLLLADVSIVNCGNCTSLPPLGSLLLLKKLLIKGMHEIKVIGSDFTGDVIIAFPTLEILVFEDMLGWEVWSIKNNVLNAAFPCLRELQIKNCPNLIDVSLEAMPSLKVLHISECDSYVLRNLVQIASSIAELKIKSVSGLTDKVWRGVIGRLWAVKVVNIIGCNEMRYLWKSEEEASKVLVHLEKLEVFGCSNLVSLGEKEEDSRGSNLLTSLRNLEVWFCGSMQHCCCPNNVESLTISSCSSLTHLSFRVGQKLRSLSIYGCHKLMDPINNTSMSMLEVVDIRCWSNLKSIIELGDCFHLTCLKIQDCESLESFPDFLPLPLTHLTIGDCPSLESFPDLQLSNCTLLTHLEVTNCPSIDTSFPRGLWPPKLCSLKIGGLKKPISEWGPLFFPSSLVCLKLFAEHVSDFSQLSDLLPSSLSKLHIQEFDELESLSIGLQHLTSLQHLGIHNCPKMIHLPKTLLPSLLTLEIFECPNLKRRCSGKRSHYWPIISHIPCIDIQDGYSFIKEPL